MVTSASDKSSATPPQLHFDLLGVSIGQATVLVGMSVISVPSILAKVQKSALPRYFQHLHEGQLKFLAKTPMKRS